MNDNEYVDFGDVARKLLNEQCQYISRYVGGKCDEKDLGFGLRFMENGKVVTYSDDYHSLKIHKDDVDTFVNRVKQYRENQAFMNLDPHLSQQ
jgi:hypothetical protein